MKIVKRVSLNFYICLNYMGSAIRWGRPWRSMFLQLQPLKRPVPWVEVSSRRPSSPREGDDHAGLKVCGRSLRSTLVDEVDGSNADVEMGSARVRQRSLNASKLDHDNMALPLKIEDIKVEQDCSYYNWVSRNGLQKCSNIIRAC